MKPTPQPKPAPCAPKARVMWGSPPVGADALKLYSFPIATRPDEKPVAVIPCATVKQARALVRFANMTEGERVGAMARSLKQPVSDGPFAWGMSRVKPAVVEAYARAIHDLIFKGGAK